MKGPFETLSELIAQVDRVALLTVTGGTDPGLLGKKIVIAEDAVHLSELSDSLTELILERVTGSIEKTESSKLEVETGGEGKLQLFYHCYSPPPRLIILGGGHVGAALCQVAANLDFELVVIDDRPSFANRNAHPHAHHLICDSFERALEKLKPRLSDYIVIVTRGHSHDRLCLERALSRDATYIGMIGSRSRVKSQLRDLASVGYSEAELARIHTPIGLNIGAVTEAEIAISILAEVIQVRRKSSREEAVQQEVLKTLVRAEKENMPSVLITMTASTGSTPRKAGSQVVVFPDGLTVGTIGGGCAEADAKREALNCLDTGCAQNLRLKLTADAAADEGMACGGMMDLFMNCLTGQAKN
jgi:xanthine dehydrogenase accessory factor